MAVRPGEENVATLFADLHYFYGPPTAKPPHHRFDKSSYVYLFEDSSQRRARLEIANNPGTPDQDAFSGYLDTCHIDFTHKHPTLVTITTDSRQANDTSQWHLPTFDPRNENKYMYRLHTVDIYFWTKEDGIKFIEALRRVLPAQALSIKDEPAPTHTGAMSSVVQKLEQVAITEPSYHAGASERAGSARSSAPSFPGPPKAPTPASQESSQGFTPIAYNPAAPAAPEAIKHREKTPPPEDGGANPLAAAATSEHVQPFSPSPYTPGFGVSSPPSALAAQAAYLPQAPPSAGLQSPYSQPAGHPHAPPLQRGMTFPVGPGVQQPAYTQVPLPFSPPPTQTQFANYPGSPGFAPSALSPAFGQTPMSPPAYTHTAPSALSGFQGYQYQPTASQPGTPGFSSEHNIHQQMFQPGKGEKMGQVKDPEEKRGLEAKAAKFERGVGSFLNRVERALG